MWANLVEKIATVSLSWKLVLRIIWVWRIQEWSSFLPDFDQDCETCSKNQNCWSSNLESRLIWICRIWCYFSFFLVQKDPFCANLIQKLKSQFKIKFGSWINFNMQNFIVMFTLSILDLFAKINLAFCCLINLPVI